MGARDMIHPMIKIIGFLTGALYKKLKRFKKLLTPLTECGNILSEVRVSDHN